MLMFVLFRHAQLVHILQAPLKSIGTRRGLRSMVLGWVSRLDDPFRSNWRFKPESFSRPVPEFTLQQAIHSPSATPPVKEGMPAAVVIGFGLFLRCRPYGQYLPRLKATTLRVIFPGRLNRRLDSHLRRVAPWTILHLLPSFARVRSSV